MSLFEKSELLSFLDDTYLTARDNGISKLGALKLTRKEYKTWVSDFASELKEQIKVTTLLDPTKAKERIEKQKSDFHYFRRTYFPHYYSLEGKSKLQDELETIYYKIIDDLKPMGLKFAIAAPRGFGKSTDVSIAFPIWCIVNNYKHFITLFSDAIELAETLVEAIKAELEENERLKQDFSNACGIGKVWKIGEIVTNNNIKVKAYGSGKRVRGVKHGTFRPDLAIIDDLENDTNVRSRTQRDKLEDWLDEAIDNLGSVDGSMDILYIGTILHRDSVLARKLKLAFWHPVKFRALVQYPKNIELWDEYSKIFKYEGVVEAHNFYLENKEQMDSGAVLLWDAVSLEYLMQKRAANNKAFQKEQQNNPNSENQKFDTSKFPKISKTQMPKLDRVYGFVDVKGDSATGDYFAVVVGGVNDQLQKLFIFYSMHGRIRGRAAVLKMLEIVKDIKIDLLGGDKNGGFHFYRDFFKSEAWHQGVKIPFLKFTHHTTNKEDKMGLLEFPITDEDIIFVGDHPELFQEMEDFPESEHDDLHDALYGVYDLSRIKRIKKDSQNGGQRTNTRNSNRHKRPNRRER
ncbi:hypothetical protein [Aliarcobacter butzleri]|uniref:hypothetical protein n=1 Tax=Aliarcobacter butzleri TaxID=28197 RepID=UPI001EDC7085|nr:hypothetical protein [Aliarcobacter butzleri]MCG3658611.1 hypothetical protein [Aliarcobacter butzleri]